FPAVDSIRGVHVTAVQSCALPILPPSRAIVYSVFSSISALISARSITVVPPSLSVRTNSPSTIENEAFVVLMIVTVGPPPAGVRSEERRVGEAARAGWTLGGQNRR